MLISTVRSAVPPEEHRGVVARVERQADVRTRGSLNLLGWCGDDDHALVPAGKRALSSSVSRVA